jgi:hypothetical protein
MATSPRFEVNQDEILGSEKKRGKWTGCIIGCLIVAGIVLVLIVAVGIWFARNWRGIAADAGSKAMDAVVDASDMPAQEKVEVKEQVSRVATAIRDGRIGVGQSAMIVAKMMDSPLMATLMIPTHFQGSGLSDDEKTQGRLALKRFAVGVIDKKIDRKGSDAVLSHIADRQPNGPWQPRQHVSDADLRAALSEAKAQADAAGVAAEPAEVDYSEAFKQIIDEELKEPAAEAPKP